MFSAVSSAFVIDVNSSLRPDPNQESAALLRPILLTLNQSAIPGETPAVPPTQENPPSEIVIATCLMYASLLISLLAALVAMLGKQWLNRHLRNSGGSMIERCGDRQRKCDGLEKWPFHFFVESLLVMLQVALLFLACGLCRYMWSVNAWVAYTLIGLTGLGIAFYVVIVIAGMSSYACPFQTPASAALRGLRKKVWRGAISSIVHSKWALSRADLLWNRKIQPFLCCQSLETISLKTVQVQRSEPPSALNNARQPKPWIRPKDLTIIRRTNTSDAQCVSWILRNITDPEALDAAIRLAGEIRWFDGGTDVDLAYGLIVCTFKACFDSTGKLYPGSRDRAYYSGQAMVWIRTLTKCKSEGFANRFLLPVTEYIAPSLDFDLRHLLEISVPLYIYFPLVRSLYSHPEHSPSHLQWISNILLHLSWANRTSLDNKPILGWIASTHDTETATPPNAILNRLLVWCIFLGSSPEEEALMVQEKS